MGYDSLRRLTSVNTGIYTRTYTYRDVSVTQTATQITSVSYSGLANNPTYGYTYDALGNIATYTAPDGEVITYTYDDQGQLLSAVGDQTYTYTYDNVGNMLTGHGHTYTYGDSTWGDLLTAVNGVTISYDEIGNPLTWYNGSNWILTWENGRQLKEIKHISGSRKTVFTYDADGLRLRKTSDGITHDYTYAGGKLMREVITRPASGTVEVWDFFYDEAGRPFAVKVDGVMYYYITNLQGDVMQIVDSNGATVATYEYDPYGFNAGITGTFGYSNPIRYRGYYYDRETDFYYLQSRYYDPSIGRFINADSYASTGQGILGNNMYAYCLNSPTVFSDPNGNSPHFSMTTFGFGGSRPSNNDSDELFMVALSIGENATVSQGVISINLVDCYDDICVLSQKMSLRYICDIIAISACDKYAEQCGAEFLLSDYCVSYEIYEHILAYQYAIGDRSMPNKLVVGYAVSSLMDLAWYTAKSIIVATGSIDMRESDVVANAGISSQAFAFDYKNGIRGIYVGTDRDPWANVRW